MGKAAERIFREGPKGFIEGMSTDSCLSIRRASPFTTRDLHGLLTKGVLKRTRERRNSRYWLKFPTGSALMM